MKLKVIINADDCGYSQKVNNHIKIAIEKHCISSTTIMANMGDFEGAVRLFKDYHECVSFGYHLNLTEGCPTSSSQILLDMGFYKEQGGSVIFNAQPFRRKLLSRVAREEIYKEVRVQVSRLLDSGISISHIDGHHFIHQSVFMLPLLPRLCKEFGIYRVRNYRNYMPKSLTRWARGQWYYFMRLQNSQIRTTDWFTGFEDFHRLELDGKRFYHEGDSVELMCHPGGKYAEEEKVLLSTDVEKLFDCQLISYNQL